MTKVKKKKKYRILEILNNNFSKVESQKLRKTIPDKLNVSERTFNNWLYMNHENTLEISYVNLIKMSFLLDVQIANLVNFEIKI